MVRIGNNGLLSKEAVRIDRDTKVDEVYKTKIEDFDTIYKVVAVYDRKTKEVIRKNCQANIGDKVVKNCLLMKNKVNLLLYIHILISIHLVQNGVLEDDFLIFVNLDNHNCYNKVDGL